MYAKFFFDMIVLKFKQGPRPLPIPPIRTKPPVHTHLHPHQRRHHVRVPPHGTDMTGEQRGPE